MAIDLTEGLGMWVVLVPDIELELAGGKKFDNRKAHKDDQISMEINVCSHIQRQKYTAMYKSLVNVDAELALGIDRAIVLENMRNVKNILHRGKLISSAKDFLESQCQKFITHIKNVIMSDIPLAPPEYDEDGNLVKEGDEKN